MNRFELVHEEHKFNITRQNALFIELLLNKSEYGHEWSNLGDVLYSWSRDPEIYEINQYTYYITKNQYDWLLSNASSYI